MRYFNMLDSRIPLLGVSYSDIIDASIDIPMRYAEFYALTRDGTRVRLQDARHFLGWSRSAAGRSFYFKVGRDVIRLRVSPIEGEGIRDVMCWTQPRTCAALSRQDPRVDRLGDSIETITTDSGGLLFLATDTPARATATWHYRPTEIQATC